MAKASTRESIVDAAVVVAGRRGISGSSMDEIAEQAGVAKGSLYYNFESKDAIFAEVLKLGLERVVEAVTDAIASVPPELKLRAAAVATLDTLRSNPDRAKIVASEMFRTDRTWYEAVLPARGAIASLYRDVLREARPSDAHRITETAGAAVFGAIAGAGLEWLLFHPDQPLEDVADQAIAMFTS